VEAGDTYFLKIVSWYGSWASSKESVDHLHRQMEGLSLQSVVGGDLGNPIKKQNTHLGSELWLIFEKRSRIVLNLLEVLLFL